jgi:hypothetical protein
VQPWNRVYSPEIFDRQCKKTFATISAISGHRSGRPRDYAVRKTVRSDSGLS